MMPVDKAKTIRAGSWIAALFLCAGMLAGCGGKAASSASAVSSSGGGTAAVYHKITAAQAKSMMDEGKPYTLVDVRTESEYKAQRIAGAILVPYDEIGARAAAELPDKSALIFTYCRTGVRSSTAAHTLVSLGYTNVYDMGGIASWPYGTVSG
jgi:rhodanese-related sulfurtransferase